MILDSVRERLEILEGEQLKVAAELSLHVLAKSRLGAYGLALARGGERVEDERLHTVVAGIELENPVMVGAGWDKKGRAVDGLYALGFAGTEVGTVTAYSQRGNSQPRLWYKDGAALNCFGFNSPGKEAVAAHLDKQRRPGVVGINIGKNKRTPDYDAPWGYAVVAEHLREYANYFVINVSSPNTPGLRDLSSPRPLTDILQAVLEVSGDIPLFVKTSVDVAPKQLDSMLEVCLANDVRGVITSNTTVDDELKAQHGWQGRPGGLSGDNAEFRSRVIAQMKHITRVTDGTGLQRIGVGGVNDTEPAIDLIEAGAQAVQVMTAIWQHKAKTAQRINWGIRAKLDKEGLSSVQELVGIAA